MATQEEQGRILLCLSMLKYSNRLNIVDIENHSEDFNTFLAATYSDIAFCVQNNSTTFDEFLFAARQIDNGTPQHLVQWLPDNAAQPDEPFERYVNSLGNSGESTRICVNATMNKINQLFEQPLEESNEPRKIVSGLVVGKVQSGKTSNYVGLMVKAFTEGWNAVIVLTSNSDLLETQTASRIQKDFEEKADLRTAQIINYDQAPTNPGAHYWQVAKKNRAVLNKIYGWLETASQHIFPDGNYLRDSLRVLIIDDESDNASLNNNLNDKLYTTEELEDICYDLVDTQTDDTPDLNAVKEKFACYIDKFLRMVENAADPENAAIRQHVEELANRVDPETQANHANGQLDSFKTYCQHHNLPDVNNVYNCTRDELAQVFPVDRAREWLKILKSIFGVAASATVINRILKRILRKQDGFDFQRSAYLGYTATPYANILCESPTETIYPDFIQSIPAGNGYYGADQIFGCYDPESSGDSLENTSARLPIVYHFAKECDLDADGNPLNENSDEHQLNLLDSTPADFDIKRCPELQKAMAWFCCSAAIRKYYRATAPETYSRKALWTTMLVNVITQIDEQNIIKNKINEFFTDILSSAEKRNNYIAFCRQIYAKLSEQTPANKFPNSRTMEVYPAFEVFEDTLRNWVLNASHLKIVALNAGLNNRDDEDAYLNYENYPLNKYNERKVSQEIAWIVVGGQKISRGLTMEGLTVSYFNPSAATAVDTLFQMGRWFGYRDGYELLPRIWMTKEIMYKFKRMALYEKMLHDSIEDNFNSGNSPKDPENYQIVYTLAGKLGKRDKFTGRKALRLNLQVPSVSVTTGVISLKDEHINNIKDHVDNFFNTHWEGQYGQSNASANSPIIKNVSKDLVIELLTEMRGFYPQSHTKIDSVISAVKNYPEDGDLRFNIVLTGISEQARGGNNTQTYQFSPNIVITAPERQVSNYLAGQFAAYAAPRAHVANQAFFSEEVLSARANEYRQYLVNRNETVPDNIRANDKFTEYLFEQEGCTNPVIQFFVLKPTAELQLNENDCLIAFSMFWPQLRMDKFVRYTCGDPLNEYSDEERIDFICDGILNKVDRAVTLDKIIQDMIIIDPLLRRKRKTYFQRLLAAAAENNLLQIFIPGQMYGNTTLPGNYVEMLQNRIIDILKNLPVAVKPDKIANILKIKYQEEYADGIPRMMIITLCEQYLNNTPEAEREFIQVPGKGPFFGRNGLGEYDKSFEGMDYSLCDIFLAANEFICNSPWEVTLDQIRTHLGNNGIEFADNTKLSQCIVQMNTQKVFRRFDYATCPFYSPSKGLYRSCACTLPELEVRIQNKIINILQDGMRRTLRDIEEIVRDNESLHPDLLGTTRVKNELTKLVESQSVKTTGNKPKWYYIEAENE